MVKDLVSIITPCYNTATYLPRLLESVLSQTYPNVEMILIDDGSTDNTSDVIKEYISRFQERGYYLAYYYQPNSGQSVAIQNALSKVNGEFLTWPDSDDYYDSPEALSKMVKTLKTLPSEFAIVRSCLHYVSDSVEPEKIKLRQPTDNNKHELFEDCLMATSNFYFATGCYLTYTNAFLESTELPIFTHHDAGQNWQMFLPVLYHYKCAYIEEPLFNIMCRVSSHSRAPRTYTQEINAQSVYLDTLLTTLSKIKDMPEHKRSHYQNELKKKYYLMLFNLAIKFKCKSDVEKYYKLYKGVNKVPSQMYRERLLFRVGLLKTYNSLSRVLRKLISYAK